MLFTLWLKELDIDRAEIETTSRHLTEAVPALRHISTKAKCNIGKLFRFPLTMMFTNIIHLAQSLTNFMTQSI